MTNESNDPVLFSPGSVRARTVSSIQENQNNSTSPSKRHDSSSRNSPSDSTKRVEVRPISGRNLNSSDFVHDLSNPNHSIENPNSQPQTQAGLNPKENSTARHKLLESVYLNNNNSVSPPSMSEPLTNGINSHTTPNESNTNCILS